jgi:hypothetical protein
MSFETDDDLEGIAIETQLGFLPGNEDDEYAGFLEDDEDWECSDSIIRLPDDDEEDDEQEDEETEDDESDTGTGSS